VVLVRQWELELGLSAGVEPELASARELVLEMRLIVEPVVVQLL
jgi:hypothetical protein